MQVSGNIVTMKPKLIPNDKIEKVLAKKGVMTAQELLVLLGNKMQIKRKSDEGILLPLGSGLYASPSLDPFTASVIATGRYYSQSVISGLTALVIHELSDESLDRVDVDVPRGTSIRNRLLNVHRVAEKNLIGIGQLNFHGQKIRIYDVERSLCEAYRIDAAGAIFYKALKRYVKKYPPKPERLAKYDQALKTQVLKHLQQELADA
jgi:predicted transcriptional regulator of viral defense system